MTKRRSAIAGVLAVASLAWALSIPIALAADDEAAASSQQEDEKKKRSLFNRLRGSEAPEPPAEAVPEQTPQAQKPAARDQASPPAAPVEPSQAAQREREKMAREDEKLQAEATGGSSEGRMGRLVEQLRIGPLGRESVAVAYLNRIAAGRASAEQLNDFATFVGKRGLPAAALEFQTEAARLAPQNPAIWVNLGTLQRAVGETGRAAAAFRKAIDLDPGNGTAHYNLGAVLDAEGKYDEAIEQYMKALRLDPKLGDPEVNPQVVNNDRLLAVKLRLYQEQAGALGLPLTTLQDKAAAANSGK